MRGRSIGAVAVLALTQACSSTQVTADALRSSESVSSTRDGAFTTAQAERGRQVYDNHCASCHPAQFYEAQLAIWENATVGEFFEALSATMPSENPGALASDQYLDVIAYILSITGSQAGEQELAMDNAQRLRIVND